MTNFNQVSEIVSKSIGRNAAIAVGVAAMAILLYISWSFRNVPKAYRYGVAAVIAAGHDGLVVLGVFSILGKLFGTEINTMFITGLLTVIGFSVHDTIVVFDRIRENAGTYPGAALHEVVNASLTETLARSMNTSITVLFTVVALLLLGGSTIQSFLLVLLVGVIAGTYSSIFVASQILVSWEEGDLRACGAGCFPGRCRRRRLAPPGCRRSDAAAESTPARAGRSAAPARRRRGGSGAARPCAPAAPGRTCGSCRTCRAPGPA